MHGWPWAWHCGHAGNEGRAARRLTEEVYSMEQVVEKGTVTKPRGQRFKVQEIH